MKINQDTLKTIEKLLHSERHIEVINKYSAIDFESKGINANTTSMFHKLIAASFNATGQKEEALKRYLLAESLNQQDSEIKSNIAGIYFDRDEYLQAEEYYEKALNIHPKNANILLNKGVLLQHLKRFQEALTLYDKALENAPRFVRAINNKAAILDHLGQYELAEATYKKALLIEPKNIEVLNNLGSINRKRNPVEALNYYEKALKIDVKNIIVNFNKANVLQDMGDYDEAVKCYEKCKNDGLDVSGLYVGLATTYQHKGQHDLAFENYKKAFDKEPENLQILSGLIFGISHNDRIEPGLVRYYLDLFNKLLRIKYQDKINKNIKDTSRVKRKLKIGFVSADFWNHAIMFFIRGIIEELSKYDDIELYGYYNNSINDSATMRLMSYFNAWRTIDTMDDVAVRNIIIKDEIDVLVDLSGHTSGERLAVFAMRAAPVQMSWLGFPGSTGLTEMDYYIADDNFLPSNHYNSQFVETIVKLPYFNFEPIANLPKIKKSPALENGYITFASFNRTNKITRECVSLWAKILKSTNSRMIVGGISPKLKFNHLKQWFSEEGVENSVVDYQSIIPLSELMDLINNRVDICLDSFPYGGGTTSFLTQSMGVPTITLPGKLPVSRQGASILKWLDLEEYIAIDEEDYYKKALHIIDEVEKLNHIRLTMRSRFHSSNISKPKLVAASLVCLFRKTLAISDNSRKEPLLIDSTEAKNLYKVNNYKRLMMTQYFSGNMELCTVIADKILKIDKYNIDAIKMKGSIAIYLEDYEKGVSILNSSLELLDQEGIKNLIFGYNQLGKIDEAKRILADIINRKDYAEFDQLIKMYCSLINVKDLDVLNLKCLPPSINTMENLKIIYNRLYEFESNRSDSYANIIFNNLEMFKNCNESDYYRHFLLLMRSSKIKEGLQLIEKLPGDSLYENLATINLKINSIKEEVDGDSICNYLLSKLNEDGAAKVLINYFKSKNEFYSALEISKICENNGMEDFDLKLLKIETLVKLKLNNEALRSLMDLMVNNKSAIIYEKLADIFYDMNLYDRALAYIDSSIKINEFSLNSWKIKQKISVALSSAEMVNESLLKINYLNKWIDVLEN
jgi:predicted O-linked N-acetylglucosamine transferase (SPINDLY family)